MKQATLFSYRKLHPDLKYSDRTKSLRALKQLGYKTGSGVMVGLPGQTLESMANDILLFKALDIDIIGITPYMPHSDTPIASRFHQSEGYFAPAIGHFDINEMMRQSYGNNQNGKSDFNYSYKARF
ncbi:MAG: hypothetical protein MZV70_76780 [Desulfobacterales bacterium]|nr:hypothetical protein [Desulfobacterales bacterium]